MKVDENIYHVPVLLHESVDGLNVRAGGVYVDVAFGGGGHSREILKRIKAADAGKSDKGHLYSFDQDADAERNIVADENFTFVRSNFRYLKNFMRYYGVEQVDGILADLGVSSHHFDDSERGFSFRFEGKLDMRMNQRSGITAVNVINDYDETKLANVLYQYGELKNSRQIAGKIARACQQKRIERIEELLAVVKTDDKQVLARMFQALRIEVNHEMEALEEMLGAAIACLKPGGRLVVITYHSLEDRMVKNFIRSGNIEGVDDKDMFGRSSAPLKAVNRKPILPAEEEIESNTRARSAKLRIAEKI